ncbi:MAG TPA: hypothetical protein EYQ50_29490 [Verrucomicrobiales bacterium]|nr:hypothetical protein [Verrucomicrobiales bacterium]
MSVSALEPLFRVIDLNIGESAEVEFSAGSKATIKLLELHEGVDSISKAVRRAGVIVRWTDTAQNWSLPLTIFPLM